MQVLLRYMREKEPLQPNHRGSEGHADSQELLKVTLDNTITKCRSCEVARKHCSDITQQEPGAMSALQINQKGRIKAVGGQCTCSGCGGAWHKDGQQQCPCTRSHLHTWS